MISPPTSWVAYIALLIALLPCLAPRLRHPIPVLKSVDFDVYYSAASLIREGKSSQLYDGADTGRDPQKIPAPIGSPIDLAARAQGLTGVGLYLYPPFLADMLVPLTSVSLRTAIHLWLGLNAILLCGTVVCLIALLDLRWTSLGSLLLLTGAFSFSPAVNCFAYGQVTIALLFLWTLAATLHARGYPVWSGIFFALAAAIKVAPALVLIPFLVWRNWRWVAAFSASLLGSGIACSYVNTPGLLSVYFHRVVPAMSRAIPQLSNMSFSARTQLLIWAASGHALLPDPVSLPSKVVVIGKIVSASILLAFVGAIVLRARNVTIRDEVVILGLLSLLVPVISPVSWLHAYALSFFGLAILWGEAIRTKVTRFNLALLTACSLLIGSYVWPAVVLRTARHQHDELAAVLSLCALLAICLLIFRRVLAIARVPMIPNPHRAKNP